MEKLVLNGSHTKDDFVRFYKKCKNAKLKERYQAMYLSFLFDWKTAAEIVCRDYDTVLAWAKAYNENGLQGLNSIFCGISAILNIYLYYHNVMVVLT